MARPRLSILMDPRTLEDSHEPGRPKSIINIQLEAQISIRSPLNCDPQPFPQERRQVARRVPKNIGDTCHGAHQTQRQRLHLRQLRQRRQHWLRATRTTSRARGRRGLSLVESAHGASHTARGILEPSRFPHSLFHNPMAKSRPKTDNSSPFLLMSQFCPIHFVGRCYTGGSWYRGHHKDVEYRAMALFSGKPCHNPYVTFSPNA